MTESKRFFSEADEAAIRANGKKAGDAMRQFAEKLTAAYKASAEQLARVAITRNGGRP